MRYVLSIILTLLMTSGYADPIVSSTAKDTIVSCSADNVESLLTAWYNNAAGGRASDPDGGAITYEGNITLSEVITAFNASSLCGSTHFVEVTFSAKDQNGVTASLGVARFSTVDNTNPVITKVPEFASYKCQEGIRDTFVTWIQNQGGATGVDDCSTIRWTRFIWNNTEGASGTGSIDNGPYPALVGGCTVNYNISFIAEDGCGNRKATTGRFSIVDDTPPIIRDTVSMISVSCEDVPDKKDIDAYDYCDPNLQIEVSETSTQSADSTSCNHYNYELTRDYTIKDACNNVTTFTRKIIVYDRTVPSIAGLDTIDIDCQTFDRQDTTFATATDNCGVVQLIHVDRTHTGSCDYSVDRIYTASDVCGNVDSFSQHIRIKDQIPPFFERRPIDTSVYCTSAEIQAVFETWLQENVSIPISDGCNSTRLIAVSPDTYDIRDTTTYPKDRPVYQNSGCDRSTPYTSKQVVDFIAYDQCGNATLQKATFTVLDTIDPIFDACPEDVKLFVGPGACTARYTIEQLSHIEQCGDVFAEITINETTIPLDISKTNMIENIPIGTHIALLKLSDCAGNSSSCMFEITVQDTIGPEFVYCGTDEKIVLAQDSCSYLYTLQRNIVLKDACGLDNVYLQKQPQVASQESITFSVSEGDTIANNKTISFKNVFPSYFNEDSICLSVNINAQLDSNNYYDVFGEGGEQIGVLNNATCQGNSVTFLIDRTVFNTWSSDGEVDISFITTGKISPCAPISQGNIDGVSKISGVLSYSDAEVLFTVSGATEIAQQVYTDSTKLRLNAGENTFTYSASDVSGNETMCSFVVTITDNNKPVAKCKNAVVFIHPDGEQKLTLDPTLINDSSNDNCGEVTLSVSPSELSCEQINTQVQATLMIFDKNRNESTCTATIKVEPYELKPTYSAGVCTIDTLRLFANAPASTTPNIYSYQWSGPNGFTSKIENPFIPNANDTYNGTYTVTVTGLNGCATTGSVLVSLTNLQAPQITFNTDTICVGEELVLNATTYTGNVTYEWYEGSHPEGKLLSTTNAPSYTLRPENGAHRYYVLVKSSTCASTASNTIAVMSIERPQGMVNDNFINVCEGASFALGTMSFGPDYTYLWEGPNGFTSSRPLPEAFKNVQFSDGGTYSLVVSAGSCHADTVTTKVNVFNKPTKPIITADDAYCQGSTVALTVNNLPNGDVYTWFLDRVPYTTESGNSLVINNAQTNIAGSWQVTVKSGICTSDTSDVRKIVIDDFQDVSVTNNGPACLNDTIQLFATFIAGATYAWTGPDDFTSTEQNPKINAIAGEYTVIIRTGSNCETTASTTVKINKAPTITALSNNSRSCMERGAAIEFYPTVVPNDTPLTYRWRGPNGYTSTEQNPTIKNDSSAINGIYTLEVINGACVSEAAKTTVEVTTTPAQPTIDISSNNICQNSMVKLSSSVVSDNLKYIWKLPNGQTSSLTSPELIIQKFSSADVGEYTLALQRGNCTSTVSEAVELNINTTINPPFFTTNSPVCLGGSLQLSVTDPKNDVEYLWEGPTGKLGTGKTLSIPVTEEAVGKYKVQLKRGNCLSGYSAEQKVDIIKDVMTPKAQLDVYTTCRGASGFQICVSEETYVKNMMYLVISGTDTIAQADDRCIAVTDYSKLKNRNDLKLIAQKQDCYSDASPSFTLVLNEGNRIVANDDTYSSLVNAPFKLSIFDNDTLPEGYTFEIIDQPTVGELDIVGTSILFLPKTSNGTSVFTYRVCDEACKICDDAQVKIVIGQGADCTSITIISPNDDNVNDTFVIDCLADNAFPDNVLTVFNQWGDEVYSVNGYDNTWTATDIPDGTYFYILDLGNGSEAIRNFLMIQR